MNALMKFDPATGDPKPYPSEAAQWRCFNTHAAWLFCPWSGLRRNAFDVGTDPYGLLINPPGEQLRAAPAASPLPAIGAPFQGGIFAGVSRGEDGQPDAPLILLPDRPKSKLTWADAKAWAEGLGDGARLPTRFESALLYAHLRDQMNTDGYHWTNTPYSDGYVWVQTFTSGNQRTYHQGSKLLAVAGRRFNPSTL